MEQTNLYHYTDFNAMTGIITKGEIWLWNLRRMNDSQEMQYFVTELKAALTKELSPDYYPAMEKLFDENLRTFDKLSSFAACFSEYADDAAQWARYAKNGMGVCIAFDKELLSKIGEAGHAPLCQVNYSRDCGNLEIVQTLCDLIKNPQNYTADKVHQIFNKLITSSPLFKHPSFISEKEYRLVSLPYEIDKHLGAPHFYVEETNIKKYYILNLKNVCQNLNINYADLFKQIYIGPQARVTKEVLADYFTATEMEALVPRIIMSDCPLRRF